MALSALGFPQVGGIGGGVNNALGPGGGYDFFSSGPLSAFTGAGLNGGGGAGGFDLFGTLSPGGAFGALGVGGQQQDPFGGLGALINAFGGSPGGAVGGGASGLLGGLLGGAGIGGGGGGGTGDLSSILIALLTGGGGLGGLLGGGGGGGLLDGLLGGGEEFAQAEDANANINGNGNRVNQRTINNNEEVLAEEPRKNVTIDVDETAADGGVEGDPHFYGFEGDRYDVMGKDGGIYNLVSGQKVQLNARFDAWGSPDATIIGQVGIQAGDDTVGKTQIEFDKNGVAKVDGQVLAQNATATFETGLVDENGNNVQGTAKWVNGKFVVNTGEYQFEYESKDSANGKYIDQKAKVTKLGVHSDGVQEHGLLGQTANFDGVVKNGKLGVGAQGEGAIEGVVDDYKVANLFDDNFKFNRFNGAENTEKKFGVGADKAGGAN